MKRMFKPLFILGAILSAATLSMSLAAHDQHHTTAALHNPHQTHDSHDHVAVSDMRAHATHYLGGAMLLPHSYGSAVHWSHDWELRWADYKTAHNTVRIYHATYKHNDVVRYTSSCARGQTCRRDWQRIH